MKEAYCGDGILRYCLGKIFLVGKEIQNQEYTGKLEQNKILAKTVRERDDVFGEQSGTIHFLGTVYEAKLFEIFDNEGKEKCIEFVKNTFNIKTENAYDAYCQWERLNITYGGTKKHWSH